MAAAASVIAGTRYEGAWDDGTYHYDLVLAFTSVGKGRTQPVEGTTEWTLRAGPGMESKFGESAVESWKGQLENS